MTLAIGRRVLESPSTLTVGNGGQYATVADAVAAINATSRYTTVYSTGTATLTNGSKKITPTGGATWEGLNSGSSNAEIWLYLDTEDMYIPLSSVAVSNPGNTVIYDWGELKYNYEGATAAKSYEFRIPNWYHIKILGGETIDTSVVEWPLFTTLSGVSTEAATFRGAISVNVKDPGIWCKDLKWGGVHGLAVVLGQEAFITVIDTGATEEGYADVVVHDMDAAKGNADADFIYTDTTPYSYGTLDIQRCEIHSYYDVTQSNARNFSIKNNKIYIVNDIDTVIEATGLRWGSTGALPITKLTVDITGNEFYIYNGAGSVIQLALVLAPDNIAYLTNAPDIFGQIVDNYIELINDGTGNVFGIEHASSLWGANSGRVLIDRNMFNLQANGGTVTHIRTHATNSPFVLGQNNTTYDGSALAITGAPFRFENGGSTGAIATGATVAHGLRTTPTKVNVTPKETGLTDIYVTADGTNITVNYAGGGTHDFWWSVEK